jgi:predicted dehydrogenase
MANETARFTSSQQVDPVRRRLLKASVGAAVASAIGVSPPLQATSTNSVRWGFVGTGSIANTMAWVLTLTSRAELVAVSSRRMESAKSFASDHGASFAFDSWEEMLGAPEIDAVYVATPTSVREEICLAAARQGKHVLGEKPFASLRSLQNIIAACREHNVSFMDGTHFVHHPRTHRIREQMPENVGWPWSVDSAFQINLPDKSNIRYNPELEPMGAIGDLGWYNMRAAVEYLAADAELASSDAYIRRDTQTGAAVSGSGVLRFSDGSTSTWNCAFDSGAFVMDLRISGSKGSVSVSDFLTHSPDNSAEYLHRSGGWGPDAKSNTINVESTLPGAALMFEDFADTVDDPTLREQWMRASRRTQALLDATWQSALGHE